MPYIDFVKFDEDCIELQNTVHATSLARRCLQAKDPIVWNQYKTAPFYSTLLHLSKKNPALAADASYMKLQTGNDMAIFAYAREKAGRKIAVILNLSDQPQRFTIDDKSIFGNPLNIFLGVKEKVSATHVFSIEQWGYIVYEYK